MIPWMMVFLQESREAWRAIGGRHGANAMAVQYTQLTDPLLKNRLEGRIYKLYAGLLDDQWRRKYWGYVSRETAFELGSIAFLKAIRRWNPAKGGKGFYSYLYRAFANSIIQGMCKEVSVPVGNNCFQEAKGQLNNVRLGSLDSDIAETMLSSQTNF